MKLIVGLGNPGRNYAYSRHNIGFRVIKHLARLYKVSFKNDSKSRSLRSGAVISGKKTILAVPLTFMNLSGKAVKALLDKYELNPQDLLVVCDDLDLDFARIKIRPFGSSGGHRGLNSIIDSLGSNRFCRMRIGIGRPKAGSEAAGHVLSKFTSKETKQLEELISKAADCCCMWVAKGVDECMNAFNKSMPAGRHAVRQGV